MHYIIIQFCVYQFVCTMTQIWLSMIKGSRKSRQLNWGHDLGGTSFGIMVRLDFYFIKFFQKIFILMMFWKLRHIGFYNWISFYFSNWQKPISWLMSAGMSRYFFWWHFLTHSVILYLKQCFRLGLNEFL